MYLSTLRLDNYKSFKDANFKFAKITLLLGPNSGGKTSLLASVLSCLQSPRFPVYFSPNGSLVETGDYREIVKSHRVASDISLELSFVTKWEKSKRTAAATLAGVYERDPKTNMPRLVSANLNNAEITWDIAKSRDKYALNWKYRPNGPVAEFAKRFPEMSGAFEALVKKAVKTSEKSGRSAKQADRSQALEAKDLVRPTIDGGLAQGRYQAALPEIFEIQPGTSEAQQVKDFWALAALRNSKDTIANFNKKFAYIGSYRIPPQRTYYHLVGPDLKVGVCGQNTIEQILAWENAKSPELHALVKSLKSIGLASNIRANKLAGGRFEVVVKSLGSSVNSPISDVGFGINQFLPVLVAELQLKNGSTVAVSQPETHLHPSVQAEIASHFVKNVKDRALSYLVETHSEYIINRLRRHIVAGDLAADDVSIYYLEQSNSGAVVHKIDFEKSGKISGAPPGFFTTYQVDVMNIAMGR